jgi:hypothetical protein
MTTSAATTTAEPQLKLGMILSKGIDSYSTTSFLDEEDDEELEPFSINAETIAVGRTCIIGSSGSGKSYTVGVICEELCKNKIPFVIVDLEGEYSGLKEKYEAIWVGEDEQSDLRWSKKIELGLLARYAPDCPPIILDLSETGRVHDKVNQFLIALYKEVSRRRTPYLVILEEADRFSPQTGGERLPIFDEIARRGRKRGLGLMLCTQRPSLVDKNILSQCSNQLIGKLVIKNDLNSVAQFFSDRSVLNQLTALKSGEFFALGGLAPETEKVKIRARETRHGGVTPKLNLTLVQPPVDKILESVQSGTPMVISTPQRQSTSGLEVEVVPSTREEVEAEEEQASLADPPKASAKVLASPQQGKYEIAPIPKTSSTEMADEGSATLGQQANDVAIEEQIDWINGGDQRTTGILGLAPMVEAEAVPRLVKLEKSYKLFGQKENVMQVALAFRPLVEVGVRIRVGMVKKKFETKYFFMDGVSGKLVVSADRLILRSGIERLLGLQEGQVAILKVLHPDRDLSLIEIASACKRAEDETRRLLKGLEAKRLVRSTKYGRVNMYRRLLDLSKIDLGTEPLLKLNELNTSDGFKLAKLKIKEDQVREVVKGLWSNADIESFRQIYYPVYLAELVLNGRKRYVWIDGRSGKEIEM